MNIEPKYKNNKAHNNVKDGGYKNMLHTPLSGAGLQVWQKQYYAQHKLDAAENGEDIHMASFLSNFRLNHNSQ